ncbi:unnamed protein product, partial [Dovyalis caffra]
MIVTVTRESVRRDSVRDESETESRETESEIRVRSDLSEDRESERGCDHTRGRRTPRRSRAGDAKELGDGSSTANHIVYPKADISLQRALWTNKIIEEGKAEAAGKTVGREVDRDH